jgi:HSP20 family protein
MLTRFHDIDRSFTVMDELRRRMDRLFEEYDAGGYDHEPVARGSWPRINVFDAGANLVVKAEVPGLSDKQLAITVNQDVLTLTGERKADIPEGYSVHRQERAPVRFSRSFTLPTKIDSEKTSAAMKDGVLTITLAKAAEAQPRQIAVSSV